MFSDHETELQTTPLGMSADNRVFKNVQYLWVVLLIQSHLQKLN